LIRGSSPRHAYNFRFAGGASGSPPSSRFAATPIRFARHAVLPRPAGDDSQRAARQGRRRAIASGGGANRRQQRPDRRQWRSWPNWVPKRRIERQVTAAFPSSPKIKGSYITERKPTVRFRDLSREEQQVRIRENPLYAQVVCRCEQITEAEIVEAIRRPLGASTVNGIKLRTRAGMGRCQSGFCLPKILTILAREKGIPEENITLFGTGSEILKGKTRYEYTKKKTRSEYTMKKGRIRRKRRSRKTRDGK